MATSIWTYQVYDQNTPSELFGEFSPMVDLWRSRFAGEQLPSWRDFELEDFAGWYGHVSLGDVATDFSWMKFVLWGTAITRWWGKDYTGKVMDANSTEVRVQWETIEKPYISSIFDNRGIGLCQGQLTIEHREFVRVSYVEFPLMYNGTVSRLMSVYCLEAGENNLGNATPLYGVKEVF